MNSAIVVGGGIVGIACARELARAGVRVQVFHDGPLAGGATAAGMGHLVALDDRDPVARFTLRSLELWDRFDLPASCEDSRCGCLWVAADDEEMAEAEAKHARYAGHGVTTELCDARRLAELEPELATGLTGGLLVPSDRVIYPPRATSWLWDDAQRHGAVRQRDRVVAVEPGRVTLVHGTRVEADWIVVAAGDRMARLVPSIPVVPRKGHLVITSRAATFVRHQVVELGYVKKAHRQDAESVACNVQPRVTGQVLIGSSRQLGTRDPRIEPGMLARMLEEVGRYFPRIHELEALRAWTGLRATTPDGAPVIGVVEPGLAVAGGHEGVGITQAPATAELIRDLLLGRPPAVDAVSFDPRRFVEAA
jgi:glycine/D-amino acid oxidase-like deaminating enzyme